MENTNMREGLAAEPSIASTNEAELLPVDRASRAPEFVRDAGATPLEVSPAATSASESAFSSPESAAPAEQIAAIHARNDWLIAADQALADVRRRSYEGKLTTPDRWVKRAFAPAGVDGRAFASDLLAYIEDRPHAEDSPARGRQDVSLGYDDRPELDELDLDDPLPEPEVTDIVLLYGKSGTYAYSKPLMSHSFAHALFNTAEGDELATFVDVVRTESKVYPRPVSATNFLNQPYLWSPEKVASLFERAINDEAYADIETTQTSLSDTYFYSTKFLSPAQAKALAEWHGVERFRNP